MPRSPYADDATGEGKKKKRKKDVETAVGLRQVTKRFGLVREEGVKLFDGAIGYSDHFAFTLSEGMIEVKRPAEPGESR